MSEGQFAYVLELLDEHCVVLPASALADERPPSTDRPAVVISFDDGYAETFSTVLPLLAERTLTAAFFVVTSEIGLELDHTTLDASLRRASWAELRAACAAGHVIASHGHHHEPMWDLTNSTRDELRHSQRLLSAQLERTYDLFAFPYGVMPSDVSELEFSRAFSTAKAARRTGTARRERFAASRSRRPRERVGRGDRVVGLALARASCTVCHAPPRSRGSERGTHPAGRRPRPASARLASAARAPPALSARAAPPASRRRP